LGFFFSSRRRHTRSKRDWSSDVCSSDLLRTDSAIFADARQVSTVEELHSAMEDPEVSAISICAPIALTSNVRQTKPVLVTAEATVTMVGTVPYSWKVLGSYLKNAGQMEINLQANGSAAVTNEGIMKLKDAQLSEASGFLNQGSVIADQLVFCGGSQGFNLGERSEEHTSE